MARRSLAQDFGLWQRMGRDRDERHKDSCEDKHGDMYEDDEDRG